MKMFDLESIMVALFIVAGAAFITIGIISTDDSLR